MERVLGGGAGMVFHLLMKRATSETKREPGWGLDASLSGGIPEHIF